MSRRRVRKKGARTHGASFPPVLLAVVLLVLGLLGSCGRGLLEDTTREGSEGPGNVAVDRFFVEPDAGPGPVLTELRAARTSLDVVVYLLTNREAVDELIEAHERGVRVRVMVEEDPFGGGAGNGAALRRLSATGVEWKYGNPTFRYTHQKAIIADGRHALVMTANLTKSAFTRNREYIALLTSPEEVREIQAMFDADWDRRRYEPRAASLVVSDVNSRMKLLGLIREARESLDIEAEVMADREIRSALVSAHERGVRVRIVMSPPEREESSYEGLSELARAGVGVRVVTIGTTIT